MLLLNCGARKFLPSNELAQFGSQQFFIPEETRHHGLQEFGRTQSCQVERMPGPVGKHDDKSELLPAIAIPKGMNGIQLRQGMCGLNCKFLLG
jgi:hypothetical protein